MNTIFENNYKVKIEYEIGSKLESNDEIVFKENFGIVEGVTGPFGDSQGAYYFGDAKKGDIVSGKLIAIIHRINDIENIWVISNKAYSKQEIIDKTSFLEQFFKIEIIL